jgi:putative phosphonate metabolism protein
VPAARYAVYFAPTDTAALWAFGCGVLGYDAAAGAPVPRLRPGSIEAADWDRLVSTPARYGFHATLKAPFELAAGHDEPALRAALHRFAATCPPFVAPALRVDRHRHDLALVPVTADPALDRFAAACVRAFEPFRAPLSPADRKRRLAEPLDPRQRRQLDRWGYPFVFEDFRFHMTLAGPVPDGDAARVIAALSALYGEAVGPAPLRIGSVALFAEPERGSPFVLLEQAMLGTRID